MAGVGVWRGASRGEGLGVAWVRRVPTTPDDCGGAEAGTLGKRWGRRASTVVNPSQFVSTALSEKRDRRGGDTGPDL